MNGGMSMRSMIARFIAFGHTGARRRRNAPGPCISVKEAKRRVTVAEENLARAKRRFAEGYREW